MKVCVRACVCMYRLCLTYTSCLGFSSGDASSSSSPAPSSAGGSVLVFLAGTQEINDVESELANVRSLAGRLRSYRCTGTYPVTSNSSSSSGLRAQR